MDKRQFILDTLLPYKQDPSTCGFFKSSCMYLTEDGRKCAVGKHMKPGPWQDIQASVVGIDTKYGLTNVLTDEANAMNLTVKEWQAIQGYHDALNGSSSSMVMTMNFHLENLEKVTGLKFPELKFQ